MVPCSCASMMSAKSEANESSSRTRCSSASWFVTITSSCIPSATKRLRVTETLGSDSPSFAPTILAEKWSTTRVVSGASGLPSSFSVQRERWRTSSKKKPSGFSASMSPFGSEKTKVEPSTMISCSGTPLPYPARRADTLGNMDEVAQGLWSAFQMAWEVWWALVLGFLLSGIVQAWVPRARMERALGGSGPRQIALATGLGAASSSCSYAAIAIAKSLFAKGASAASALAFQFASTNLVWELGLVLWILIGWQFTLAEFIGGLVLVAVVT